MAKDYEVGGGQGVRGIGIEVNRIGYRVIWRSGYPGEFRKKLNENHS